MGREVQERGQLALARPQIAAGQGPEGSYRQQIEQALVQNEQGPVQLEH